MNLAVDVRDLNVRFGAIHAVRGVSFALKLGSATALVGPNGAGKSTIFHALANALPSGAQVFGTIAFDDAAKSRAARYFASVVPERGKIFPLITVDENLQAADRERNRGKIRKDDLYTWFPRIARRRTTLAGNLSGGEQQMLAIAMALFGPPTLLALDEPTQGLSVPVIEQTCEMLARLRRELRLTLLVAEADARWLARLADQAIVLSRGTIADFIGENLRTREDYIHSLLLGGSTEDIHEKSYHA